MKIVVSEMPETPKDCMFSEKVSGREELYACTLRPYIEEAEGKPKCLCKNTGRCDRLSTIRNEHTFL